MCGVNSSSITRCLWNCRQSNLHSSPKGSFFALGNARGLDPARVVRLSWILSLAVLGRGRRSTGNSYSAHSCMMVCSKHDRSMTQPRQMGMRPTSDSRGLGLPMSRERRLKAVQTDTDLCGDDSSQTVEIAFNAYNLRAGVELS